VKNSDGQLYTIEGLAAALVMLLTAYFVINATSVYTAGDTHITDMQLEALGTDALRVMDANESRLTGSPLRNIISNVTFTDNQTFGTMFGNLINSRTGAAADHIQYSASYSYRDLGDNSMKSMFINASRNLSGGEHAVRATKWVIANVEGDGLPGDSSYIPGVLPPQNRAVLVEVLLWRD